MNVHEASDLMDHKLVPCGCGKQVNLINVKSHRADNEITHWSGECPECHVDHTILND